LLTRIIKIASQPGDLVMDPFTGSGTTAVVAHALGRNFTGFEIDEKYAEIARKRVADSRFIPTWISPPGELRGSVPA